MTDTTLETPNQPKQSSSTLKTLFVLGLTGVAIYLCFASFSAYLDARKKEAMATPVSVEDLGRASNCVKNKLRQSFEGKLIVLGDAYAAGKACMDEAAKEKETTLEKQKQVLGL